MNKEWRLCLVPRSGRAKPAAIMAALQTLLGLTGEAGEVPQECLLITLSLSSSIPKASLDSQAWIPHSTPNLRAWEDKQGLPWNSSSSSIWNQGWASRSKLKLRTDLWDGEGGGRGVQDGGHMLHPWLIHVNVWQKPSQYCKGISLQSNK